MDPHPSQQHGGVHRAAWQLQTEVTRPKATLKPTLPEKSGVDGGANQGSTYLGQSLHWWSSLATKVLPSTIFSFDCKSFRDTRKVEVFGIIRKLFSRLWRHLRPQKSAKLVAQIYINSRLNKRCKKSPQCGLKNGLKILVSKSKLF